MALFKKSHSRAKPIVDTAMVTPGISFSDGSMKYQANLCAPGGPPYEYFALELTEEEMLRLVSGWLEKHAQHLADQRNAARKLRVEV